MTLLLGVIGGSGLYQLPGFEFQREFYPETPWGYPSAPIGVFSSSQHGFQVAFLARHGPKHCISPSGVPYAANICAMKMLGVQTIVAFSAVGSLQEGIKPGDFVLPRQAIDWTRDGRRCTFFNEGVVAHTSLADPFHKPLADFIKKIADHSMPELKLHCDKTVITIAGPHFSTRVESHLFRTVMGCDIINMTTNPECKLAREAEISYQTICMATDYDCWREDEEAVSVERVMEIMRANGIKAKNLIAFLLPELHSAIANNELTSVKGCMQYACMTPREDMKEEIRQRLAHVLPEYYK